MKKPFFLAIAFALVASAADKDAASAPMTRTQADAILDELRQIHALLEKLQPKPAQPANTAPTSAPPTHITLKLDSTLDHIGKNDAPLTIVEFADYECAFCRQFHITAYRDLRKNYIETGRVRFYSLDLPLEMHNNAKPAALAAHCAGEQGQYWSMREALIGNGARLSTDIIIEIARGLYMDIPKFQNCFETRKYTPSMDRSIAQASSLSITGTPTFIIGKTTADGVDGVMIVGAQPYETFDAELKKLE